MSPEPPPPPAATETSRSREAVSFLAKAGALLERFDPSTSLQSIVDLAVPALADWCFIHLKTTGHPALVAIANADPVALAAARTRAAVSHALSSNTAVARVLAGGPREIVDVDARVLEQAAQDAGHLVHLRDRGYRSAVVAPLAGRDGVLGAVTFAMAESGRRYEEADLDMLAELARRTGIALENARLFAAEQHARSNAEEARDRTRRLQKLTATLSGATEKSDVVSIMVDAGREALGAAAGFAWLLRDPDTLELAAAKHGGKTGRLNMFDTISMSARLPVCDVIRAAEPLMFENLATMASGYPAAIGPNDSPYHAWAVIPFVVSGRSVGAVSFSFAEERSFSDEDRELLVAMIGQASLALERARLLEAERRARAEAETAVERAHLADRRKDEFLAMLGHELRNPLAPIATALDLMELKGAALLQNERGVIRRQVEHLSRLVDDLLDVSRITRGKIKLARRVVEVGDVLKKAIETASPLLEKRMLRLGTDVPATGLPVDADPTRLAQVFQNLLTNAAKYSQAGTEIEVSARRDNDSICVSVRDHGMGIPADLMPELFGMFVQGRRGSDRSDGGLGIGLTIAKSLCDLHGGTIEATSAGTGHGSTFTVKLPVAKGSIGLSPAPPRVAMPRPSPGVRVLIVDDNVDAALTLQEVLVELGYESVVAHDGLAALDLASSFNPHVAVLDIGLPVMDGYELARKLRERFGAQTPRLIAVTGYGQDSDRARAHAAGFDHHLVKPIDFDSLAPLLIIRSP
ncbi:MAG: hypothetical protein JWM82_650 [Myxococcales bacterium]|nr:hypothetical protein [Myxococcales bacterium]